VDAHRTLNYSKDAVKCKDMMFSSSEEIVREFRSQGVACKNISVRSEADECYKTVIACAICCIACNKLHAIVLGSRRGYRCQSVCDWWRHIRNVVWRRVTVIITWFHQTLPLAATLWPREYFRTRLKACSDCMEQLQSVACNKLHM